MALQLCSQRRKEEKSLNVSKINSKNVFKMYKMKRDNSKGNIYIKNSVTLPSICTVKNY